VGGQWTVACEVTEVAQIHRILRHACLYPGAENLVDYMSSNFVVMLGRDVDSSGWYTPRRVNRVTEIDVVSEWCVFSI
jgi:hypothetical protein